MTQGTIDIVVAGHICLDVIPEMGAAGGGLEGLLTPGSLVEVGPAVTATGGAVSNTGLALHRLGLRTRLMGMVGDDIFGEAILERLRARSEELARGMIVAEGGSSSYTLVISPPGVDRVFLHSPGVNNTYRATDIPCEPAQEARIFHFGYPPIMRQIYADGGTELAALFRRLRGKGVAISLDMSQPDPDSQAGAVDWRAWLEGVLPQVDIFAPSFEEILFMLDRPRFEEMLAAAGKRPMPRQATASMLETLSGQLLEMGARVVALKLGDQGLYLRTSRAAQRFEVLSRALALEIDAWRARELLTPCFKTAVAGTTGAGDTTVAGLLAALIRGQRPERAITSAVGVGAFSVEAADATSGVPDWPALQARIRQGWEQLPLEISLPEWRHDEKQHLLRGPGDSS